MNLISHDRLPKQTSQKLGDRRSQVSVHREKSLPGMHSALI
jgi:hypothetical protein